MPNPCSYGYPHDIGLRPVGGYQFNIQIGAERIRPVKYAIHKIGLKP